MLNPLVSGTLITLFSFSGIFLPTKPTEIADTIIQEEIQSNIQAENSIPQKLRNIAKTLKFQDQTMSPATSERRQLNGDELSAVWRQFIDTKETIEFKNEDFWGFEEGKKLLCSTKTFHDMPTFRSNNFSKHCTSPRKPGRNHSFPLKIVLLEDGRIDLIVENLDKDFHAFVGDSTLEVYNSLIKEYSHNLPWKIRRIYFSTLDSWLIEFVKSRKEIDTIIYVPIMKVSKFHSGARSLRGIPYLMESNNKLIQNIRTNSSSVEIAGNVLLEKLFQKISAMPERTTRNYFITKNDSDEPWWETFLNSYFSNEQKNISIPQFVDEKFTENDLFWLHLYRDPEGAEFAAMSIANRNSIKHESIMDLDGNIVGRDIRTKRESRFLLDLPFFPNVVVSIPSYFDAERYFGLSDYLGNHNYPFHTSLPDSHSITALQDLPFNPEVVNLSNFEGEELDISLLSSNPNLKKIIGLDKLEIINSKEGCKTDVKNSIIHSFCSKMLASNNTSANVSDGLVNQIQIGNKFISNRPGKQKFFPYSTSVEEEHEYKSDKTDSKIIVINEQNELNMQILLEHRIYQVKKQCDPNIGRGPILLISNSLLRQGSYFHCSTREGITPQIAKFPAEIQARIQFIQGSQNFSVLQKANLLNDKILFSLINDHFFSILPENRNVNYDVSGHGNPGFIFVATSERKNRLRSYIQMKMLDLYAAKLDLPPIKWDQFQKALNKPITDKLLDPNWRPINSYLNLNLFSKEYHDFISNTGNISTQFMTTQKASQQLGFSHNWFLNTISRSYKKFTFRRLKIFLEPCNFGEPNPLSDKLLKDNIIVYSAPNNMLTHFFSLKGFEFTDKIAKIADNKYLEDVRLSENNLSRDKPVNLFEQLKPGMMNSFRGDFTEQDLLEITNEIEVLLNDLEG